MQDSDDRAGRQKRVFVLMTPSAANGPATARGAVTEPTQMACSVSSVLVTFFRRSAVAGYARLPAFLPVRLSEPVAVVRPALWFREGIHAWCGLLV